MIEKNKERLRELADKWLKGTISQAEQQEFDDWFNQSIDEQQEIAQDRSEYRDYLFSRIKQETGILQPTRVKLWPKVAAVAAAIACILSGVYFFNSPTRSELDSGSAYANDITPGKQGATLTLASGKKIKLNDAVNGELAEESGVSITKTAEGKLVYQIKESSTESHAINILATANGEVYDVILPDGSKVTLNASSSLKYPASFAAQKKRAVELQGEAYFQIAKDKLHPFVVKHGGQEVEVLGTHFNVSAYPGEANVTTLEEGSVKVTVAGSSKVIVPGQQAVNDGNQLKVQIADLDEVLAWKNGNFIFSDESIQDIMGKLQRWYDIEVVYEGEPTKEGFYANISRYKNISQVLKMLEKTKAVHFEIKGRRITVRN
ncbi:MAG: FecR domain-containing protein [Bacteroidota bacterium]